jgi:hypothetical protein
VQWEREDSRRAGKVRCSGNGTYCFAQDTPLPDGTLMSEKQEGDFITAYDTGKKTTTQAKISKIRRSFTSAFTRLWIAGSMLSVTPAHAFLKVLPSGEDLGGAEWIAAGQLEKGTSLRSISGVVRLDSTFTESVSPTTVISYELKGGLDYLVGEMPVVVNNVCNLKTLKDALKNEPSAYADFLVGIKHLKGTERAEILAELAKVTDPNQLKGLVNSLKKAENSEAWLILKKNNRIGQNGNEIATGLIYKVDAIEALAKIKKNPRLSTLGLTDDILGKIKGHTNASFTEVINDLDGLGNFLHTHPNTNLVDISKRINTLTGDGTNVSQGVHGVIKEILENPNLYRNKRVRFELSVDNLNDGVGKSRIDIETNDIPPLFVERKWLTTGSGITENNILTEFINRDLYNITDLSQLRWSIKGVPAGDECSFLR